MGDPGRGLDGTDLGSAHIRKVSPGNACYERQRHQEYRPAICEARVSDILGLLEGWAEARFRDRGVWCQRPSWTELSYLHCLLRVLMFS